jgi:hypothetical protein
MTTVQPEAFDDDVHICSDSDDDFEDDADDFQPIFSHALTQPAFHIDILIPSTLP